MSHLKVLLVDDEPDYLELMSKRLTKRGFVVTTASGGEEALRLAADNTFDAAVLDMKMPGMNGLECLRRLKEMRPLIHCIMLTGHADLSDTATGFALGAFEYLVKPVHIDELVEAIVNVCSCGCLQPPPAMSGAAP